MKKLVLGGVLGGVVIFVWMALSWMVFPWHTASLLRFNDEEAMRQAIAANAPEAGMYALPSPTPAPGTGPMSAEAMEKDMAKTPHAFVAVRLQPVATMAPQMIVGILSQVLTMLLASWLLLTTSGLSYMGRVGFITVLGMISWLLVAVPEWNWWSFSAAYTIGAFLDVVVGMFLAGLVVARVVRPADA